MQEQTSKHPCYSLGAHVQYARMHLPVAPQCNISCNYCNRKYDCVHESRPGVTSEILTPEQALRKFTWVKRQMENLTVVGIAGPGDALANWPETKKTLELIRRADPEIIFCLSTNGLMLPEYSQDLISLGVNHVTVTMNCLDPEIGSQIYGLVRFQGQRLDGVKAAQILIARQQEGIRCLAEKGVQVKVNIVMMKYINQWHIPDVARKAKELGACMTNIMPLIPAGGSIFSFLPQTSMREVNAMRALCGLDIKQMMHCRQCRADAIGLLSEDRSAEFRQCDCAAEAMTSRPHGSRDTDYKIAVATRYGKLVDLHFGHAEEFRIYAGDGVHFELVEIRPVVQYCRGTDVCDDDQKEAIAAALSDCHAVLTMRIGHSAQQRLRKRGILSVEHCYTVDSGLSYAVELLRSRDNMAI